MSHPDLVRAVEAIREHPTLDRLVSDTDIKKHLTTYGGLERTGHLTLGTALLRMPWVTGSLERQLSVLESKVYQDRVRSLVKQLLNGSDQFLHTLSELAVALQLHQEGWDVEIASVFYKGKDVDVLGRKDGNEWFIDVVNLQARPREEGPDLFLPGPPGEPQEGKAASKVITKYQEKFQDAFESGWKGEAWIALDYGKDHQEYLQLFTREFVVGEDWQRKCVDFVAPRCPGLTGVIYFSSTAECPTSGPLSWTRCQR